MTSITKSPHSPLFITADGEVAQHASAVEWAQTPLGAPSTWSTTLRTAARMVLTTRLPMTLGWGPELVQIYNDAYIPILGAKHPDALGRPVREVYPEIWDQVGPLLEGVYQTGEAVWCEDLPLMIERRGFRQEGYFTFSYSPVRDEKGRVAGLLSSAVETTARVLGSRRNELLRRLASGPICASVRQALGESLRVLAQAPDDLPVCIMCEVDPAARHLEVLGALGVHAQDLADTSRLGGWMPWGRLDGEPGVLDVPASDFGELDVLDDGRPGVSGGVVLPIWAGDQAGGRCCGALLVGLSDRLADDHAYRAFLEDVRRAMSRKLTDLHYHELQVTEAENRYRAVFERSLDAMFLTAPDGSVLAANQAACELLGYTEAEICELGREGLVDRSDERLAALLAMREATGRMQGELDLVHCDGHTIPCELTSNIYRDAHGNERTSMVVRDIRQRLELESELRQAQKLDIVGKLAGGIAHDFNNLLTVIHSAAQFLSAEVEPGTDAAEDVHVIREASERAAALTRRLLAFSRSQPVQARDLNLAEVIKQVDSVLRPLIGENIEVVLALEPRPWTVRADQQGIEQILLNLAVNARDAMPTGGALTVELTNEEVGQARRCVLGELLQPGRYVRVCVSDTGCGVPAEVGSRVFEPFFTTKQEGTGLGLATVADITLKCGGRICMESTPGQGTSFEVFLPVSQSTSTDPSSDDAPVAPEWLTSVRVLLVEDQPVVRKATARMLAERVLEVVPVSGGAEALAVVAERGAEGFDLVITDVVMPHMSGEQVVRTLREAHPGLAFLMISGYPDSAYLELSSQLEVELLMKPYDTEELIEAVHRVLQPVCA